MKKLYTLFTAAVMALTATASDNPLLWVVGEGVYCGWNAAEALAIHETVNDHVYSGAFYINAGKDFKFMTINKWNNPEWGIAPGATMDENGTVKLAKGYTDVGYSKFKLPDSANYHVTIDIADEANATATFKKIESHKDSTGKDIKIPAPSLYLIGDATPNGWDLLKMTPLYQDRTDPYIFVNEDVYLQAGDNIEGFKINIGGAQSWAHYYYFLSPDEVTTPEYEYNMVQNGPVDFKFKVPGTGNYTVKVDLKKGTSNYQKVILADEENILVDNAATDAPVEYFDLQGRSVANPANGIYIRRQGNTVTKLAL